MSDEVSVEVGYGWLADRVANSQAQLKEIEPQPGSVAAGEDPYFAPMKRTLDHCIKQPLYSALDHLALVATWIAA